MGYRRADAHHISNLLNLKSFNDSIFFEANILLDRKTNDILTVLAVGVFADKKVHSSELQVFIRSVSGVRLSKLKLPEVSETKALAWFEVNKPTIRKMFDGPNAEFNAWFVPILERVGEHANKDELLHLLNLIFIADDENHSSEMAMMALVKHVWELA